MSSLLNGVPMNLINSLKLTIFLKISLFNLQYLGNCVPGLLIYCVNILILGVYKNLIQMYSVMSGEQYLCLSTFCFGRKP
mgnify:CR=1 FL=1